VQAIVSGYSHKISTLLYILRPGALDVGGVEESRDQIEKIVQPAFQGLAIKMITVNTYSIVPAGS